MITFSTTEYVLLLVGLSFLSAGSTRLDAVLSIAGFTLVLISWTLKARRESRAIAHLFVEAAVADERANADTNECERHHEVSMTCNCIRTEE
jgi:hypothetical protein